ncbi:chorion class CB protein M5H4-like [Anticarsia gemmatalis]|uniref:chorion class CB protein M5H4-like n=1 Tax=Anticarsia gemmatalis TaxID=129554 RepID=UPI003F769FCC
MAYDAIAPCGYEGLAAPFAYDRLTGPLAYDGLIAGRGLAFDGYAPAMDFTPTSGGGLTVTSASAIAPTGISVVSENAYEGILTVAGEVPFIGTTGMEGVLPTAGSGAVSHACGNGINAMAAETTAFAPGYAAAAYAPAAGLVPFGAAGIAPAAAIAPAALAPGLIAPAAFAPGPLTPAAAIAPAAFSGCGRGLVY